MFITCCIAVTCTFNAMVVDNDLLQLQSCIYSLLFIFVIIIILLYTALLIIFYKIPINISEYLHLYVQCGGECHWSNNTINSVYPLMLFFHSLQFVVFMVACWKNETSEFTSLASFILSSSPPSLPPFLSVSWFLCHCLLHSFHLLLFLWWFPSLSRLVAHQHCLTCHHDRHQRVVVMAIRHEGNNFIRRKCRWN